MKLVSFVIGFLGKCVISYCWSEVELWWPCCH